MNAKHSATRAFMAGFMAALLTGQGGAGAMAGPVVPGAAGSGWVAMLEGDARRQARDGGVLVPVQAFNANPGQPATDRTVQEALNYFGYDVGTPDGVLGRRSRAAIGQFQLLLGYPPSGELTGAQRQILVDAYLRAAAGDPEAAQFAGRHPMGARGLLLMQRDLYAGLPGAGFGAPPQGAGAAGVAPPTPMPSFGATPAPQILAPVAPAPKAAVPGPGAAARPHQGEAGASVPTPARKGVDALPTIAQLPFRLFGN